MKFKVQLGPRARAPKFPYLTLQASYGHMYHERKVKSGTHDVFHTFGVRGGVRGVYSVSCMAVVV